MIEGKICWDLYIDGLVVSSDGNLLDALGAAIKVVGCSYLIAFLLVLLSLSLSVYIIISCKLSILLYAVYTEIEKQKFSLYFLVQLVHVNPRYHLNF